MNDTKKEKLMLISSMVIFGTIGVFRKFIPLPSATIAMTRGFVGALFLLLLTAVRRQGLSVERIRRNLVLLIISGVAMGFNWILLFEAYNYTSVATATLCYYMAPTFIILASPIFLQERLSGRKIVYVIISLLGMVLVSGVLETDKSGGDQVRGVLYGLGAAVLYASVILMNKRLKPISAYEKTVVQLLAAAIVLLPYTALTGDLSGLQFAPLTVIMLAIVCIVHTGVAYALYFGCMEKLPAQTLALFSYIDPVVAVLLSALLLHEKLSVLTLIGAVLVLGSAVLSELPEKTRGNKD